MASINTAVMSFGDASQVVTSAVAAAWLAITTAVSGKTNAVMPAAAVLNIAVIPAQEGSSRLIPNRLFFE